MYKNTLFYYMKKILPYIVFAVLVIVAIMISKKIPPISVVDFEQCAKTGGRVMESYPRQCRYGDQTFTEVLPSEQVTPPVVANEPRRCNAEQKKGDVCAQVYAPVCAIVNVQCIKEPCNPVPQTFSNECEACHNALVESYTQGECK